MTEETRRAIEMLRVAAKMCRTHCAGVLIFYDEAKCDGICVADDCEAAARDLEAQS